MPEPVLYVRNQLAARLSCSVRRVDELIASGELRAVRIDRRPRVSAAELERFIARHTEGSAGDGAA